MACVRHLIIEIAVICSERAVLLRDACIYSGPYCLGAVQLGQLDSAPGMFSLLGLTTSPTMSSK